MAVVFSPAPGRVVELLENPAAGFASFIRSDPLINFRTNHCLIKSLQLSHNSNYQANHSLAKLIQIYVFGDRTGEAVLNVIAFHGLAGRGVGDCNLGGGFDSLARLYEQNRIGSRIQPLREFQLVVGTSPIRGLLTGVSVSLSDPEMNISEFSLRLLTIPEA